MYFEVLRKKAGWMACLFYFEKNNQKSWPPSRNASFFHDIILFFLCQPSCNIVSLLAFNQVSRHSAAAFFNLSADFFFT